jgi:hypothetical protein
MMHAIACHSRALYVSAPNAYTSASREMLSLIRAASQSLKVCLFCSLARTRELNACALFIEDYLGTV